MPKYRVPVERQVWQYGSVVVESETPGQAETLVDQSIQSGIFYSLSPAPQFYHISEDGESESVSDEPVEEVPDVQP